MPHQRRASALGCRGRSPLAHQNQAGTDGRLPRTSPSEPPAIPENGAAITSLVSSGRPSVAPIHKKTRATGVDGTSQRLASSGNCGPRPRLKVRASPGAEAGDLRRRSDRDTRPRPPPGGLGEPRRPDDDLGLLFGDRRLRGVLEPNRIDDIRRQRQAAHDARRREKAQTARRVVRCY